MTPAYSIRLDPNLLAEALHISVAQVYAAFTDGRVISRFVEHWAEQMFGLKKYINTNHKGSDVYYIMPDGENIEFSVRTLTAHGIRFQDSKHMGAGRTCSMEELKACIRRTDRWLVFDIRLFPLVTAYKVKCSILEQWMDKGELTTSGLSAKRFCALLNRDATAQVRQLEFRP
jgi:hypothetical protein